MIYKSRNFFWPIANYKVHHRFVIYKSRNFFWPIA